MALRLTKKRVASQVYNTPKTHVTRDYREGVAKLGDLSFVAIDTSGAPRQLSQPRMQAC